jgi:D-alanyl-D-alanine carboxypeptidase/D-alanyl-D-alanine-endopeptidase (penicillin-binding protein 4)
VYGDESLFDTLRGGPDSGYRTSPWVGPLSALDFNHGYGSHGFLANPALTAAQNLKTALKAAKVPVSGKAATGGAPDGSVELAEVRSPTVATLLRLQNKDSDNFFAEMLGKGLAVSGQPGDPVRSKSEPMPVTPTVASPSSATPAPAAPGPATTKNGAKVAISFARSLGATPALVDGSGLSSGDRASPRSVATLLDRLRDRSDFKSFYNSLPIAGHDGTLDHRMRSGPAHNNCHAKTGTLTGVSALSGYCTTRGGRTVVFSILMNGVNISGAHTLQDRMAQAIAGWRG